MIRRLRSADTDGLVELMSDERSLGYMDWPVPDQEEVEHWAINAGTCRMSQQGGQLCLGIELPGETKIIGFISVYYIPAEDRQATFTVIVSENRRNRGYASEAARGILRFALSGIGLHRVAVSCDSRNLPARRMLENAGMRLEGEFIRDHFVKGEWVNTVSYALLQEEFEKEQDVSDP